MGRAAEGQVHHLHVLPAGPGHRREDRVLGAAGGGKRLCDDERRARRNAPIDRARACGDAGDVGAMPDIVPQAGAAEVLQRRDAAAQVGVRSVDAGVDDRDAHAGAGEAGVMEWRDMEQRDAVDQQRLDRERRPGGDADRAKRLDEGGLPVGGDVEHDDVRALVGLAHRRTKSGEEVGGDARVVSVGCGALGVAGRELGGGHRTQGLDDETGTECRGVLGLRAVRSKHGNSILTSRVKGPAPSPWTT